MLKRDTRERGADQNARQLDQDRQRDAKRAPDKRRCRSFVLSPLLKQIQTDNRERERRNVRHETSAGHDPERREAVEEQGPRGRDLSEYLPNEQKEERQGDRE